MAVELKRFGGVPAPPLSLRRSLNPHEYRLSFQSPPSVSRRSIAVAVVKRNPKRLKYSSPPFTKEDGLSYLEVDPAGSDAWKLDPIIELLKEGAVGVIPTDTVLDNYIIRLAVEKFTQKSDDNLRIMQKYAIVCDMRNNDAIERLRRIKGIESSKPLSILCRSFKDIDKYTTGFPRGNGEGLKSIFRAVKHCLPGPYTFILTASKDLPKQCMRYGTNISKYSSRKNVGVRIPDDNVCKAILDNMDAPLISTSVKSPKEDEWILDPVIIADMYKQEGLDFVVAAGTRIADPSTVVDMTGISPQIIRQGKGPKQPWMDVKDDGDSGGSEDFPL